MSSSQIARLTGQSVRELGQYSKIGKVDARRGWWEKFTRDVAGADAAPKDLHVDSFIPVGGWPDALLPVPRPLSTLEVVQVAFHCSIALCMHVLD